MSLPGKIPAADDAGAMAASSQDLNLTRLDYLKIILLGLLGGLLSGLLGVSGGVVTVPAFVFLMGWSQGLSQGTALAVSLPPVGILAVWDYYQHGHVQLDAALIMAAGLFVGGYFGGKAAGKVSQTRLRQLFGGLMVLIGLKMLTGL